MLIAWLSVAAQARGEATPCRRAQQAFTILELDMTRYLGVLALAVAIAGCTNAGSNNNMGMNSTADPANNGQRGTASMGSSDRDFIMDAAASGMYEVQSGEIASTKGTSAHVKMIGQHMVADHTRANDQLLALAKRRAVAMPPTLRPDQREMITKLNELQGSDFDKEYLRQQEAAHREAIAKFQAQAKSGKDAELRRFAAQTLPTLQEHLRMVTKQNGDSMRMGTDR
jgi:putative membrane protein